MNKQKLGLRNWVGIILIGLAGQLAWAIENNFINLWVYSQSFDTKWVTIMTMTSAVAATVTTLFMGALSDRLGKRKIFIAGGYMAWGVSVFLFGIMSNENMKSLVGAAMAATMVGTMVTIIDILMTFFGSTANDACYNAHITDITNPSNRGKVESIVSVLPLFANITVVLIAGIIGCGAVLPDGKSTGDQIKDAQLLAGPWFTFFLVFGIITFLIGVAALFILPKEKLLPSKEKSYWSNLIHGFKPSVIKEHKTLYIALLAFMAFNCAIDAFMPYYMIYFQVDPAFGGVGLGNSMDFYICLGIILTLSSIVAIVVGLYLDKIGKLKLLLPAIGLTALGFLTIFFSTKTWSLAISGTIMMSGYLICTTILGAEVRDDTPKQEVGLFQGIRMAFVVLIPMIIGPLISQTTFKTYDSYVDAYGQVGSTSTPNRYMFLIALGFIILSLIPVMWLLISKKKEADKISASINLENKEESTK